MKFNTFLCLILCLQVNAYGQLKIDKTYQNKDLYIINSFSPTGVGFCIDSILINGSLYTEKINSTAVVVGLTKMNFTEGDSIKIRIYSHKDCTPKVLNPNLRTPRCTVKYGSVSISPDGLLEFTASNELTLLTFNIEQYRWNRWVKVGEVIGKGGSGTNSYSLKTSLHAGENTFRIVQNDLLNDPCLSQSVKTTSSLPANNYVHNSKEKTILFDYETMYQVRDEEGYIIVQGKASEINLSNFIKGTHFLSFGNQIVKIKVKK